jgi:hypothetical protein
VFNNIVFANANTGIVLGAAETGVAEATVAHNTIYGNTNRGVTVGLGSKAISDDVAVVNNIMAENRRSGIEIGPAAVTGLTVGFNCNVDGTAGLSDVPPDLSSDPLLVDPNGPDGILGGTGVGDNDFHLSQAAAGQDPADAVLPLVVRPADPIGDDDDLALDDERGQVVMGHHGGPRRHGEPEGREQAEEGAHGSWRIARACSGAADTWTIAARTASTIWRHEAC